MARSFLVNFRVTTNQYERIRTAALAKHVTISSYLRDAVLDRDLWVEKKLQEIHSEILLLSGQKQKKKEKGLADVDLSLLGSS